MTIYELATELDSNNPGQMAESIISFCGHMSGLTNDSTLDADDEATVREAFGSGSIVDRLNAYDGDNIWQDVILPLGIDEDATERLDPEYGSDVFVLEDGRVFVHQPGQFAGQDWKQEA